MFMYFYVSKNNKLRSGSWLQNSETANNTLVVCSTSRYAQRQGSGIQYYSYGTDVDLRVIVIAYHRAKSLQKCLNTLDAAHYDNSTVSIHVWIDRDNTTGTYPQNTYDVAKGFRFSRYKGKYHVHVQATHVGIQGQWINTWWPGNGTKEIGIILEDDMDVSPYFWRWLQGAAAMYNNRHDVSGYSLYGPGKNLVTGAALHIAPSDSVYMYPIFSTWAFAPHPISWSKFQEWYFTHGNKPTVDLQVPGILPWHWYKIEKAKGRAETVWSMWFTRFTYKSLPQLYTILPNTGEDNMFAVNRQPMGLHYRVALGPSGKLVKSWKEKYGIFPESPTQYDVEGHRLPN